MSSTRVTGASALPDVLSHLWSRRESAEMSPELRHIGNKGTDVLVFTEFMVKRLNLKISHIQVIKIKFLYICF